MLFGNSIPGLTHCPHDFDFLFELTHNEKGVLEVVNLRKFPEDIHVRIHFDRKGRIESITEKRRGEYHGYHISLRKGRIEQLIRYEDGVLREVTESPE